jgi:hypothetical protein
MTVLLVLVVDGEPQARNATLVDGAQQQRSLPYGGLSVRLYFLLTFCPLPPDASQCSNGKRTRKRVGLPDTERGPWPNRTGCKDFLSSRTIIAPMELAPTLGGATIRGEPPAFPKARPSSWPGLVHGQRLIFWALDGAPRGFSKIRKPMFGKEPAGPTRN